MVLWKILMEVQLVPDMEDKPIWDWNRDGKYTASLAYKMMCIGGIRFQHYAAIWKCWAPLVCKLFMWLAIQYRLWTSDRRWRHGLQEERSPCFLCDQKEDTVDHILLQCVFARQVWYMCFDRMGIDMALCPSTQDSIGRWWPVVRKQMPKLHRKGFDSVVISVCWN